MNPSKHCGEDTCAPVECSTVTQDEASALKTLYKRILDDSGPCKKTATADCGGKPAGPPAPAAEAGFDRAAMCSKEPSALKRFDANITALLDSRDKADDSLPTLPGDPVLFKRCEQTPAGAVNASVFGLDIERAVLGTPAELDQLYEAANELVMAEALCKHSGAVRAAEFAARAQPESKYAEDAARIGAKTYRAAVSGKKPGAKYIGETPIEVVGYVGCTKPPAKPEKL